MMSCIRAVIWLITFGFSVFNFFQLENPSHLQNRLFGPRQFVLLLVSPGRLSLARDP
jgi:hypothetical protein